MQFIKGNGHQKLKCPYFATTEIGTSRFFVLIFLFCLAMWKKYFAPCILLVHLLPRSCLQKATIFHSHCFILILLWIYGKFSFIYYICSYLESSWLTFSRKICVDMINSCVICMLKEKPSNAKSTEHATSQ